MFVVVTCIGAAAGVDGAWAHEPAAWQRAHAAALAQGWSQVGLAGDTATAVTLALAPGATRETALYSVSDPRSPQYGQHLTQAELRGLVATPVPVRRHVRAQVGLPSSPAHTKHLLTQNVAETRHCGVAFELLLQLSNTAGSIHSVGR